MSSSEILTSSEIEEKLQNRPLWKLKNGKLSRKFQAKNFHEAMNYLSTIGHISDEYHHHPDIHLTEYKTVEIELSTPRLGGITNMDFQMVDLFDAIPVDYSLLWKHAHPSLVGENKPSTPPIDVTHKYETIFPHHQKIQQSTKFPDIHESSTVHSNPISTEPGSVQHSKPFYVPTAQHTQLGKSDIEHHAQIYQQHRPRSSSGTVLVRRHPSTFETKTESDAWNSMAHALQHLVERGYDVGISTAILPMVNSHEIYPSWEDEMHTAYVHINKRLSPAWLETEPADVVSACREFVDGYNTIFADDFMT